MNKVHHIGIIVKDLKKYHKIFRELGGRVSDVGYVSEFGAICLFIDFGNVKIELIKPHRKNKNSKHLSKFLKKYGEGLHHIAFKGKGSKKGALLDMFVDFNKPNKDNRILIETVEFKKKKDKKTKIDKFSELFIKEFNKNCKDFKMFAKGLKPIPIERLKRIIK